MKNRAATKPDYAVGGGGKNEIFITFLCTHIFCSCKDGLDEVTVIGE